jgi:hypothetical protein
VSVAVANIPDGITGARDELCVAIGSWASTVFTTQTIMPIATTGSRITDGHWVLFLSSENISPPDVR